MIERRGRQFQIPNRQVLNKKISSNNSIQTIISRNSSTHSASSAKNTINIYNEQNAVDSFIRQSRRASQQIEVVAQSDDDTDSDSDDTHNDDNLLDLASTLDTPPDKHFNLMMRTQRKQQLIKDMVIHENDSWVAMTSNTTTMASSTVNKWANFDMKIKYERISNDLKKISIYSKPMVNSINRVRAEQPRSAGQFQLGQGRDIALQIWNSTLTHISHSHT